MGLLDDAIREHLELKRRRGEDPAEIEREEREALGPVRRGPEPAEPDALSESAAVDDELDYAVAPEDELSVGEPPEFTEPGDGETRVLDPIDHEAFDHDPHEDDEFDDEPLTHGELAEEPLGHGELADERRARDDSTLEDRAGEPPARPTDDPEDHLGPQTAEYHVGFEDEDADDVEHHEPPDAPRPARERAPEPREEDMLEETPEFLQDAPEHDRLWFEQRPPRDFDFDG